jgi:hypothetical protein
MSNDCIDGGAGKVFRRFASTDADEKIKWY